MNQLTALWTYRSFILGNVKRDFQSRYRNSALGAAWAVLNPLAMIVVYTVIFSQVMHAKLPGLNGSFDFSIYLCAGLLTWGLFSEISSRALGVFLENANLLKKLKFPKLCLFVIITLNAIINFSIVFGLFTVFLLLSGNFPGWSYLAIAPLLLIVVAFALGLGLALGILNVFFRDIGQFFGIALQFWFWLTPIVYPVTVLPLQLQSLMAWNPMFPVIQGVQSILIQGVTPHWKNLTYPILCALLLCILSIRLFRQHADEIVDEL